MTEAAITELFGARCAEFDAGCAGCYVWRAHDEYATLVAAARQVTCRRCNGKGVAWDLIGSGASRQIPCPDCADLRRLLGEGKP